MNSSFLPVFKLPANSHKRNSLLFLGFLVVTLWVSIAIGFNPVLLVTELPYLLALVDEITPPNFSFVFNKPDVILSVLSTIGMSFIGTFFGGSIALLLSFFAARNVVQNRWISSFVYLLFPLERVIPSFVLLLIFLIIAGIGPFAGTLALIVSTIGTFGKLFAESMEQIEEDVLHSVQLTGANRFQWVWFGLLPEATPAIIGNFFYAFDVNIRRAIGLGIFGGGGLGFDLYIAMGMMEYSSAFALMIVIIVLVFISERLSNYLRAKAMNL